MYSAHPEQNTPNAIRIACDRQCGDRKEMPFLHMSTAHITVTNQYSANRRSGQQKSPRVVRTSAVENAEKTANTSNQPEPKKAGLNFMDRSMPLNRPPEKDAYDEKKCILKKINHQDAFATSYDYFTLALNAFSTSKAKA